MKDNHQSEFAKRAYAIWELEGRPSGKDLDHWLRAETEFAAAQHLQPVKVETDKPQRSAAKRKTVSE